MAGKKPAKPKKEKTEKKPRAGKKPAVAAAASGGGEGIGHNSRIPPISEVRPFFSRLDKLFEQMASKRGEFMLDIKAVRSEAAGALGVSRAVFNVYYNKYRAEEKFAKDIADLESKAQDDMDRLMAAGQSFGPESPFGAYCIAQGGLRPGANAKAHDEVPKQPLRIVPKEERAAAAATPVAKTPAKTEGFAVGLGDDQSEEGGEDATTKH